MATKAGHLELVNSLTTEAFLAALKRLMARRGMVADIWSDNATNFTGADRKLKRLYNFLQNEKNQSELIDATQINNIRWHFNPPLAPHFGGLWETGIKSVKNLLKRALGNANLTYEETYRVWCR